jgi:Unpaired protein
LSRRKLIAPFARKILSTDQLIKSRLLSRSLQGLAHKWHQHTQIYVASLSILHKYQLQEDVDYNNHTTSSELKEILDRAQELLCEIEQFVNATSNRDGKHPPEWYTKKQMSKIVTLRGKNLNNKLNNKFVKARFQLYIERLYKRTVHFNLQKNLEVKSLRSISQATTMKPRRGRKNRNGRRRTTLTPANGAEVTTKKTIIVTTKRSRPNTRTTRLPGQKKRNRVNQSLQ